MEQVTQGPPGGAAAGCGCRPPSCLTVHAFPGKRLRRTKKHKHNPGDGSGYRAWRPLRRNIMYLRYKEMNRHTEEEGIPPPKGEAAQSACADPGGGWLH